MAKYKTYQQPRRRRPVILKLLVNLLGIFAILAMAGLVYWVLKPARVVSDYDLLSCLPPKAEIVVFQRSLETDWLRLRSSKWFQGMMARPEFKEFARHHGLDKSEPTDAERWILDVIGGRVLAGYVPNPQKPGRYNVFAFAPVGNRAQRLEMWAEILQHGSKSGFTLTATRHAGAQVIRVTVKDWPEDLVVKYTKLNGIMVAVLSESEDTLERYLDREAPKPSRWKQPPRPLEGMAADFFKEFADQMDDESYRSQRGLCRGHNGLFAWSIDTTNLGSITVNTHAPLTSPPPLKAEGSVTSSALLKQLPANPLLTMGGRFSEWCAATTSHTAFFDPVTGQAMQKSIATFREATPWMGDHFAFASLRWQTIAPNLPIPAPQWATAVECYNEKQARTTIQDALQDFNSRFETRLGLAPADADGVIVDRLTAGNTALGKQVVRWPAIRFNEGVLMAASDTEWLLPMLTPKPVKNQSADENRLQWDVLHTFQTIRGALDAFAFYQLFAKNHPLPTATTWQPRVELGLDLLSGLRTITATCKIENGAAYFWIQAIYDELAQRRSASAGN